MWVTNQEQAMVSDLGKTIVDAVSNPHFCGKHLNGLLIIVMV
jgi:predicted transcriptional regulator of viral defense system